MRKLRNVEFLVTNPSGQQEGYIQARNSYVNNISNASYGVQQELVDDTGKSPPLPNALYFGESNTENGVYILQIISRQTGKYHGDIEISWGPMKGKAFPIDGEVAKNQSDYYTISFPAGSVQKTNK